MYDKNNVFAKILRKEIPCNVIYEDEKVLFFEDINPQAKIHILAIPKMSVVDYYDFISKADTDTVSHFFSMINFIIDKYSLKKNGFRVVTNSGKDGNQEVPHFHFHILGGENLKGIRRN
tara:strand:+ start:17 stop:373 length:357 start_codon:yes stop_codon:yes gene_type:complete